MRHVFLMDPLDGLSYDKDTTVGLIHAVLDRGDEAYFLDKSGMSLINDQLYFQALSLSKKNHSREFEAGSPERIDAEALDFLWIRTDPPFDTTYLTHTWLLDHAPETLTILNRPEGIRTVNEKLWALQFSNWTPPTLITQSESEMKAFAETHKTLILKPTHLFGGQGIFKLDESDSNLSVAFETLSQKGSMPVICQAFVPEAASGDKRILLVNGEPLGAVLRRNDGPDHRNNVFAGGVCHPAEITDTEKKLLEALGPKLRALGLFFVGIDLLGDRLIEVNVTSPTCLIEMSEFAGRDLAADVIQQATLLKHT